MSLLHRVRFDQACGQAKVAREADQRVIVVVWQHLRRPRIGPSETKGGVDVEMPPAASVCEAYVRANSAAGAVRDLSVL